MSGIEVAGLVLGAIPLLIAALEHYEGGLDSARSFFKWRGGLSGMIQALWYQHTSYVQSIQLLLEPIATEQERQIMLDDATHILWKSTEMSEALQNRLGNAYQVYMHTVQRIEDIVKAIAEKLNIQGANKASTLVNQKGLEAMVLAHPPMKKNGNCVFQFKQSVNFNMSRRKVRRLLDELKSCNMRLDSFANKAEKLEEPFKADMKPKFTAPLITIEENAAMLYKAIYRTWTEHKAAIRQKFSSVKDDASRFGISLFRSSLTPEWLDVEIRLVETPPLNQQRRPTVRISAPVSPGTAPPSIPQAPYPDISSLQIVDNLCSIIQTPGHPWMGFCLDGDECLRGTYPTKSRASGHLQTAVTLEDLFLASYQFSKEDLYCLCVTLSSSLIQLSHTPWLCQTWDKSDIVFLRRKDNSGLSVSISHPYLKREHSTTGQTSAGEDSYPKNDCPKLLALGVLLVEIVSCRPVESMRRPEDLGPDANANSLTDFLVVRRWIQEQKDSGNLTLGFYSAISHCLKSFADPTSSLLNEDVRMTVEERVLAPLQQEMRILFG
ncbi:hypothetical protein BCR34DRAFT_620960 [Clohesyomyces aquaticus]|uniref:DUF7580 domain-containing protein n=1 Tax=Clohesyomyces aquaticus TaxID=1231657 RepID=A0A1Y2AAG1_9PLEO|nr:hypothetical protein BCR34DRAFT_620960 [Clohesyomyces aquaticus]